MAFSPAMFFSSGYFLDCHAFPQDNTSNQTNLTPLQFSVDPPATNAIDANPKFWDNPAACRCL